MTFDLYSKIDTRNDIVSMRMIKRRVKFRGHTATKGKRHYPILCLGLDEHRKRKYKLRNHKRSQAEEGLKSGQLWNRHGPVI